MDKALRFLLLFFIALSLSAQRFIPQMLQPAPASGGATFSVVHSVAADASSLTLTSTTAGNANIFCLGWEGTAGQSLTVTDNATGGSNTYTLRSSATAVNTSGSFNTQCWDSLGTAHGGATSISVSGLTSSYSVSEFYEVHRTSGTWTFDVGNALNNGTASGTLVTGPALSMTGAPGFGVTSYLVNNSLATNPATGSPWTAGSLTTGDGNGSNAIITASSGSQTSTITDSGSGDFYCASGVAYK